MELRARKMVLNFLSDATVEVTILQTICLVTHTVFLDAHLYF